MSKKIKKYVLPYFPYLIAFWFFSKCGTAYRMAAGANLGEKLFGMVKTIGPVFQSYAPGLGLFDLAVGVAGAVILYFVVQSKIKKARKFRRDMEYGSARWGTEKDIKPFVDPKFENNMLLTATERLTMNTRPKIPPTPATSISAGSARPAPARPAFGSRRNSCKHILPMWW